MPVVFAFLLDCHPRESGGPGQATLQLPWIPAFAGMTFEKVYRTRLPNLAPTGIPSRWTWGPSLGFALHRRGALRAPAFLAQCVNAEGFAHERNTGARSAPLRGMIQRYFPAGHGFIARIRDSRPHRLGFVTRVGL